MVRGGSWRGEYVRCEDLAIILAMLGDDPGDYPGKTEIKERVCCSILKLSFVTKKMSFVTHFFFEIFAYVKKK